MIKKKYIVLTTHGFTENDDLEDTSNMQVLGWTKGTTPADAASTFKEGYPELLKGYGNAIILCEVKNGHVTRVFIN